MIHASHRSQIAAASQPHRRKTYWHLARLLQKSINASKSRCSPWAKGYIDPDCCAECIAIQSPQLSYGCYGGQSMGGGSRIGEQLLRKLSSSLSHATLDVSLTALLGTIIHENAWDVLQKINNSMKSILFGIQNQGWKIAFWSIGVQKSMKFDGFPKKLASQTSQIASDFKSRDFKSRDADFKSLAMQDR